MLPAEPASRPEVIFLDLGDTLVRAHPSWAHVYRRVLADFGVSVEETALRAALDHTFGADDDTRGPFEASRDASFDRLCDFDTRVLAQLGQPPQPEGFYRALEAAFHERESWRVFDDVPAALDALAGEGFRLAVISNWSWTAPELLGTLGLARHFEALFISDRVGFEKPHPGIFRHALGVMGVPPDAAVHVGDSWHADVHGARGVGMAAVLIDRRTHAHGASGAAHDHGLDIPVITDLHGLLDLLAVPLPRHVAVS